MANFFGISLKPDIAAAVVKIDANKTVIDAIRATDVPGINTNISANQTLIETIGGIVDAIKLKTDATPQNVRGKFYSVSASITSSEFVELVNVSGHGKLHAIGLYLVNADDTMELKLTIDGTVFDTLAYTGGTAGQMVFLYLPGYPGPTLTRTQVPQISPCLMNLEFNSTLLIEFRRSAGTAAAVVCISSYILDDF